MTIKNLTAIVFLIIPMVYLLTFPPKTPTGFVFKIDIVYEQK